MRVVTFGSTNTGSPQTAEWHAWRAGGIGSSDAMVIAHDAGLIASTPSWAMSMDELLHAKRTGDVKDKVGNNFAVRRGAENEDAVRLGYQEQVGEVFMPGFGEMDAEPRIRASFDGRSFCGTKLLEIKVPGRVVIEAALAGKIIDYYLPQCGHQALVAWGHPDEWDAGNEFHFVVGDYRNQSIHPVVLAGKGLDMLREFATKLFAAEQRFLAMLDGEEAPPANDEFVALASQWLAAKRQADALAAQADEFRQSLVALAEAQGRPEIEGAGVRVRRVEAKGSVDYQKLLSSLGVTPSEEQMEAARKKGRTSWMVEAIRSKAA